MSLMLRNLARQVARKVANDPRVRQKALEATHAAAKEAKTIASERDRAYAAGKAVRRVLNGLMSDRPSR